MHLYFKNILKSRLCSAWIDWIFTTHVHISVEIMNIRFTSFVSGVIAHQNVMKNRKNIKLLISRSLTNFSLSPQKKVWTRSDQNFQQFPADSQWVDRSSSKKNSSGGKTSSSSEYYYVVGRQLEPPVLSLFFSALCFQNHMFLMQFFLFYFSDEARSEQPIVR